MLDEQLSNERLKELIASWYTGSVYFLNDLRPTSKVIKDDAIPTLLQDQTHPSFVTMNTVHFWRRVSINKGFCIICCDIRDKDRDIIPMLLKLLFRHPEFKTKKQRAGHVVQLKLDGEIRYYGRDNQVRKSSIQ